MSDQIPPQTFGLENCRDLCEKLTREFKRLENARDREEIADHAINFAITAWHLIDWIWVAFERKDEYFAFTGTAKCESSKWKYLSDFRKYIVEREPRLRYCGLFANSAKHLQLSNDRWPEQESISTPVSGMSFGHTKSTLVIGDDFQGEIQWKPKICIGDDRLDARAEFQAVLTFWTEFVYHETCER